MISNSFNENENGYNKNGYNEHNLNKKNKFDKFDKNDLFRACENNEIINVLLKKMRNTHSPLF